MNKRKLKVAIALAITIGSCLLVGYFFRERSIRKPSLVKETESTGKKTLAEEHDNSKNRYFVNTPKSSPKLSKTTEARDTLINLKEADFEKFKVRNALSDAEYEYNQKLKVYIVKKTEEDLRFNKVESAKVIKQNIYKAALNPNDSLYNAQWYLSDVSAQSAWDISTGGNIVMAVIDTGFGLDHNDLKNQWSINIAEYGDGKDSNGVDDDGDGYIDNWRGWDFAQDDNNPNAGSVEPDSIYVAHGTMVSGLAGAQTNNGQGIASLNWGTKILPIQVLADDGIGYTSSVAQGIIYATDHGAKVINLSLGTSSVDATLESAVNYAISQGAVVLAAAGNTYCDCIIYPANYPQVVAVGATDGVGNLATFSSYGKNLDVVAPGSGSIKTTYWQNGDLTNNIYVTSANGTSFSTPIVSSLTALIWGHEPTLSRSQVVERIINGASSKSTQFNIYYGHGRTNAYKSLTTFDHITFPRPNGMLIKTSNNPTVYSLQGGEKRGFVSGAAFVTNGYDWTRIIVISHEEMESYPIGPVIRAKEGTLVRRKADPTVYAMDVTDSEGKVYQKRGIPTSAVFNAFGFDWRNIYQVTAAEIDEIPTGSQIVTGSIRPTGTLFRISGNPTVFAMSNGTKRGFTTPLALLSNGFRWESIVNIPSSEAPQSPGPIYKTRRGTLVRYVSNPSVYIIEENPVGSYFKRGITSGRVFDDLDLKWNWINDEVAYYPDGALAGW